MAMRAVRRDRVVLHDDVCKWLKAELGAADDRLALKLAYVHEGVGHPGVCDRLKAKFGPGPADLEAARESAKHRCVKVESWLKTDLGLDSIDSAWVMLLAHRYKIVGRLWLEALAASEG
jgi:hypothetical protein